MCAAWTLRQVPGPEGAGTEIPLSAPATGPVRIAPVGAIREPPLRVQQRLHLVHSATSRQLFDSRQVANYVATPE